MILKEKKKNIGIYVCRKCGSLKKIKAKPIEIKESVKYSPPPVPMISA